MNPLFSTVFPPLLGYDPAGFPFFSTGNAFDSVSPSRSSLPFSPPWFSLLFCSLMHLSLPRQIDFFFPPPQEKKISFARCNPFFFFFRCPRLVVFFFSPGTFPWRLPFPFWRSLQRAEPSFFFSTAGSLSRWSFFPLGFFFPPARFPP